MFLIIVSIAIGNGGGGSPVLPGGNPWGGGLVPHDPV